VCLSSFLAVVQETKSAPCRMHILQSIVNAVISLEARKTGDGSEAAALQDAPVSLKLMLVTVRCGKSSHLKK
jgi:hypothetical protein